ncbi:mediator of RNA polymerase II transcription subunit 11 [Metschnikowia aff. pulcherrima]|uniref:Mediator of RNA polymerase II transcription subunit 11 n=1 Tax=Metschnikowia aff. pulcherrima TaxID=2163413 RepID=A0A4P6XQ98_9ASCO|nr:mediator of RNA polymerase II transcription subunit 11 [Metschnikowia aff. pulcherrima]
MPIEGIIRERLESLSSIDQEIVDILESLSSIFETYLQPSKEEPQDVAKTRVQFRTDVKQLYSSLSRIAIGLRKEVKSMDESVGTFEHSKGLVMILPVSIEKKNIKLGEDRLHAEVKNL